jgi:hypothetical protein
MKKYPYILILLITLLAVILAACTPADVGDQSKAGEMDGADVLVTQPPSTESVSDMKEPTPATEDVAPKQPEELPAIPEVKFGAGSDWFRPTPPEGIQLASGGVQLFEFSAVW